MAIVSQFLQCNNWLLSECLRNCCSLEQAYAFTIDLGFIKHEAGPMQCLAWENGAALGVTARFCIGPTRSIFGERFMLLRCCLFAGCTQKIKNPKNKKIKLCVHFSRASILHHCICLDMHDHGVQTGGWCSVFPGSICVSGFATPVVNCGTARVPMGLPM